MFIKVICIFNKGTAGALVSALASDRSIALWLIGYSVLMGASAAIFEVTRTVALRRHFERHFGLANAIVGVGSSLAYVLFPPGAELVLNWGAPRDATAAELRNIRTSNLKNLMLIVAAANLTQIAYFFLWTDDFHKAQDCSDFNLFKSNRNDLKINQLETHCKTFSVQKLFKWHLFRNWDFLLVTMAYSINSLADVLTFLYYFIGLFLSFSSFLNMYFTVCARHLFLRHDSAELSSNQRKLDSCTGIWKFLIAYIYYINHLSERVTLQSTVDCRIHS